MLFAAEMQGFGIPPLEGQSVGLPVVVADNTAPPDNVYNGEIVENYQKNSCSW